MIKLEMVAITFALNHFKGARGFLKPFKRISYKPHAAITSCSVFLRTLIYPFLAAIVVFSRKHAEEKEQCLLFSTRKATLR